MLQRLSAAQFAEWAAFFKIEPDADFRSDQLAAETLSMLGNIHRKEEAEEFTPIDFLPWVQRDMPPKEEVEQRMDVKTQNMQLKALFNKKGKS